MLNGVAVVDQEGVIGDGCLVVRCVPVSGSGEQIVGTSTRPGHGLVDAEHDCFCGIVIIQAGGIAAGIDGVEGGVLEICITDAMSICAVVDQGEDLAAASVTGST